MLPSVTRPAPASAAWRLHHPVTQIPRTLGEVARCDRPPRTVTIPYPADPDTGAISIHVCPRLPKPETPMTTLFTSHLTHKHRSPPSTKSASTRFHSPSPTSGNVTPGSTLFCMLETDDSRRATWHARSSWFRQNPEGQNERHLIPHNTIHFVHSHQHSTPFGHCIGMLLLEPGVRLKQARPQEELVPR